MIFEDYLPYFAYVQGYHSCNWCFYSGARAYDVGAGYVLLICRFLSE
jgi:hypothetical protein